MCGGIFINCLISNFPQNVPLKKFLKWLIFGDDMDNDKVGRFLGHSVLIFKHI